LKNPNGQISGHLITAKEYTENPTNCLFLFFFQIHKWYITGSLHAGRTKPLSNFFSGWAKSYLIIAWELNLIVNLDQSSLHSFCLSLGPICFPLHISPYIIK
jgi:hypothetical protein